MKKFTDAQDQLVEKTRNQFQEDVESDKIVFDLEVLLRKEKSAELILKCEMSVAEKAKFKLLNKGLRVRIYTELKELKIAAWK
jgi:hypothetical protein